MIESVSVAFIVYCINILCIVKLGFNYKKILDFSAYYWPLMISLIIGLNYAQ